MALATAAPTPTLPPDVLLRIFKLVYAAIRPIQLVPRYSSPHRRCTVSGCGEIMPDENLKCACGQIADQVPAWDGSEDIFSPALFPYSLAAVCTSWKAALVLSPEFWTRVVVVLDSLTPSSLQAFRDNLKRSRTELIDILIFRRDMHTDMNKHVELARVQQILDAVQPHLERCKYFCIYVKHTSSLPSISPAFIASMPHLTSLLLRSTTDSGPAQARVSVRPRAGDGLRPSKWPVLRTLIIDGWNFAQLCRLPLDEVKEMLICCRSLVVENGGGDLPFSKFVELLKELHINRLVLKGPAFTGTRMSEQFHLTDLDIRSLSAELTTATLSSCIPTRSLRILECPLGSVENTPIAPMIALQGITESHGIERILKMWNGTQLAVYACPGFDDSIIDMLNEGIKWGIGPERLSSNLEMLKVEDCPKVSKGLINMDNTKYSPGSPLDVKYHGRWSNQPGDRTRGSASASTHVDNRNGAAEPHRVTGLQIPSNMEVISVRPSITNNYASLRSSTLVNDGSEIVARNGGPPPQHQKTLVPKSVRAVLRCPSWFICSAAN